MRETSGVIRSSSTAPPGVDARLAEIGGHQYGLARTADLRVIGLDSSAVSRRVARGSLHRRYPGVYAIGHLGLSREGELLAAVFAGGAGAALGCQSAAQSWDAWRWRVPVIHVVTTRQRTPQPGIRWHISRRLDPRDVTLRDGIPVTTAARTLVDLTDEAISCELANVIHELEFHGRFSEVETRAAMERANGRHRLDRLEGALQMRAAGSAGVKSGNELRFLRLLDAARIPPPMLNLRVEGFEVDVHWPDRKLVVEIDGPGHQRRRTHHADASRDRVLDAAGYTIVRFTDADLWRCPEAVVTRVMAVSSVRGGLRLIDG